jgi:hypothetical protein
MFWDAFQQYRIDQLSARQADADVKGRSVEREFRYLERQMGKMALVNQALFELLKAETGITDEDLRRKVREIDLRDGIEDQQLVAGPLTCPKCRAAMTAGALSCPQCGATVAPAYPFET